jgi:hypothetical protein
VDSDVLLAQMYRVGGEPAPKAAMRTGIVRRVDLLKGLIDVEVAGELLRDVPFAAGLAPVVGATVWLIEQGSWFAAVSAAASSGQAAGGAEEVVVGEAPPTQVAVKLWVDTATEDVGDGWAALDGRYVQSDGAVMSGPLVLSGDPVDPLQAVPLRFLEERLQPGPVAFRGGQAGVQFTDGVGEVEHGLGRVPVICIASMLQGAVGAIHGGGRTLAVGGHAMDPNITRFLVLACEPDGTPFTGQGWIHWFVA